MQWLQREADFSPVTGMKFGGVVVAAFLLAIFFHKNTEDFLPVLDHVNLAFHEAGHLFFGLFGKWTGILGGTLGQLLMPLLAVFVFWRKGDTASFALTGIWFFENFLNIARYVADARARQLPLVGGGDHDWTNLLFRWNLLDSDTAIASRLALIAWLGIWGMVGWLGWRWYRQD